MSLPPPTVTCDPADVGVDPDRLRTLDRRLARYVDDGDLAGWSLLIRRRGEIVHVTTCGRRDVEADLPVETDSVFRIYSMSKPITSVAAMALWERGEFELTDPISRWLPEFAEPRVFSGGSGLRPVTVPAVEPIRVWHLLTHTAGLTYGFHHAHPVDAIYRAHGFESGAPDGLDLAGVTRVLAGLPLLSQPGTEWNYSVATDVLGRLVEVVSGQSLDEALRALVLDPLGMTDTAFTLPDRLRPRLAALYARQPGAPLTRAEREGERVVAPSWFSGGGGLSSTLADYDRFLQLLRGGGQVDDVRVLRPRTVRLMTANHLPGDADLATFGRPLFAESPFKGTGFGLGFAVVRRPLELHSPSSVGEYSWGGAASTAFWVDPVEDVSVVFLTQLLPSSALPLRSQLRQLVAAALVD